MTIKSKVTGKEYAPENAVYIRNFLQFAAYMNAGAGEYLLDTFYDNSRNENNKIVFVFEKNKKTKELYALWNKHLLEY